MTIDETLGKRLTPELLKSINSGEKEYHDVILVYWTNPTSSYEITGEKISKDYQELVDLFKHENVKYEELVGTGLWKALLNEKQISSILKKEVWVISEEIK